MQRQARLESLEKQLNKGKLHMKHKKITEKSNHRCASLTCITWFTCITCISCVPFMFVLLLVLLVSLALVALLLLLAFLALPELHYFLYMQYMHYMYYLHYLYCLYKSYHLYHLYYLIYWKSENHQLLTHLDIAWNQELLAHVKTKTNKQSSSAPNLHKFI